MTKLNASARLSSLLDACERERTALEALQDDRLRGALATIAALRAEIVAALATLSHDQHEGNS